MQLQRNENETNGNRHDGRNFHGIYGTGYSLEKGHGRIYSR